ncbi:MAG: hypothetical protein H7X97_07255 [Opitutaceae bacterium]|nr:hypothetical protein [Verrucomicrobiales bacterium]
MTPLEARQILQTYRPWAAEEDRAEFADAVTTCGQDPELAAWLENHCATQNAIRGRFKAIAIPEGLSEQILAERKVRASIPWLRQPAWLAAAAVVVLIAGIALFWQPGRPPEDDVSFTAFRSRMVGLALRSYGMDFETNNVAQIRAYLATRQAHADYLVPKGMAQSSVVGCGVLSWQNQRVAMICFRTGRPLQPGEKTDLLLFVMDRRAVSNPPRPGAVEISSVKAHVTASWSEQDKIYLLATPGDEAELRRFL